MEQSVYDLANDIAANDRAIGMLALEGIYCAEEGRGTAALACLFVLFEHVLRAASEAPEKENLVDIINRLHKETRIDEEEKVLLHGLRETRNKIFHSNRHEYAFVFDNLIYPFNESEDLVVAFENVAPACLALSLKLLTSTGNGSMYHRET